MTIQTVAPKIHIGRIIQRAVVFDAKNWQGKTMSTDVLLDAVVRLFGVLKERQIDYVLVGGIALLQYIEGRNTEDIDLIMALPSLKKLPEIQISSQDNDFARGMFDELKIDILLTRNTLFDTVRQRYATVQRFVEREIPCATVEGLLLLKLYALPSLYRQGNFARVGLYENDIATLVHDYHPPMGPLFQVLTEHLSATDIAAVREIVTEIQQRIERFGKGLAKGE
jgi:hypothetical protein